MPASPRTPPQRQEAEARFDEGKNYLELSRSADHASEYRSDLEEALGCFDKATAVDPDYAQAWFEKVLVCDSLASHADALNASEQVIRLLPDDPEAWFHKGIALANLGRHGEAETAFDHVLRLRPSDRHALYEKAMALRNQDRPEEELTAWRDFFDAGSPTNRGDQTCPHRWWELLWPTTFLNARFFLANSLSRLGRREQALDEFRRAIREGAQHLEGPLALSGFTDALRLSEEAREAYREFPARVEDKVAWYRKGKVFLRAGCNGDAIKAFEKVIDLDPDNADAWFWKGEALLQAGRRREALKAFETSLPLKPTAYMALEKQLKMLREEQGA